MVRKRCGWGLHVSEAQLVPRLYIILFLSAK
jgi:hypothetical protein